MVVLPLALALLATGYDRSAAQPAASARGGNPFDGEWTLQMSIVTAPGGVSTRVAAPFNSQYVVKPWFSERMDRRVAGPRSGGVADDGVSAGGSFRNDFQLHLDGGGNAVFPPETGGPERPGDRRLNLTLKFITGDGRGSSPGGGAVISIGARRPKRWWRSSILAAWSRYRMPRSRWRGGAGSTSATREEIAPDDVA
jgi:hypothetical protein